APSLAGVEPEILQVLRELAVDVPRFALTSGRAAEEKLQLREHGPHRTLRLAVVGEHRPLADPADELVALHAVGGTILALARGPQPLQCTRKLGLHVATFLGRDPVAQLAEDRERDRLGPPLVAAERVTDRVKKSPLVHGYLLTMSEACGVPVD